MTAAVSSYAELDETYPVLDTLRAVAALAVLTTHVAFWAGAYTSTAVIGPLLARLDVGVTVFFVLSGFLLSRPWLARARSGLPAPSVPRYYWKRVLRIFPVYLVTATLALALIEGNDALGWPDWLSTYFLADIYLGDRLPDGLTQMWSLATEVAFYLALPLIMMITTARGRRWSAVRLLTTVVTLSGISIVWLLGGAEQVPEAESTAVAAWLPSYLTWFAVGIAIAALTVAHRFGTRSRVVRHLVRVVATHPGVLWTCAIGLLLLASTPLAGPTMLAAADQGQALFKHLAYASIGGLIVLSGVFTSGGTYTRWMSASLPRHVGHISYSLFCIHLPVLHLVMWLTGYELFRGRFVEIFLLTLTISTAAAELLYRLVERPSMRLRDLRLSHRTGSAADTDTKLTATRTR